MATTSNPTAPAVLDIADVIDRRFSRYQLFIFLLCAITGVLDGFDLQVMGYLIPAIAETFQLTPAAFGPVLAAGFVGVAIGSSFVAPLADRIGRKRLIIASVAMFGASSLMTATIGSMNELLVWRAITGIGLGAAMPNLVTLTAEYAPRRRRAFVVTALFAGLSAGAMTGGLVSALLLPTFGWRAVFVVGGIAPLLLVPVLVALLPESARFLVVNGRSPERIASTLRRIDPSLVLAEGTRFVTSELITRKAAFGELFAGGRAIGTTGLWVAFFMNLFVLAFLASWLPTMLRNAGIPIGQAITTVIVMNLGGMAGSLIVGYGMDRIGPRTSLIGAASTCVVLLVIFALIVDRGGSLAVLMALAFAIGFCVQGGQSGLNAFSSLFYPTTIRSTGVGWAFGVGRIGSIVAPLAGQAMLGLAWSHVQIFASTALPMAMVALAVTAVRVRSARPLAPAEPVAPPAA